MARIFTILSIFLMVVLFPPSVLALISNNAVSGDPTYPIKRALENVVVSITSVNPSTKAWFSATRSDRRFEEARLLITRGKEAGSTLDELIQQTETAAGQISEVSDEAQKQKLSLQLAESIQKYDKGLEQLSPPSVITPQSSSAPVPQASTLPTVSTLEPSLSPSVSPSPLSSIKPTAQPSSQPSSTPTPSSVPSVQLSPVASPSPKNGEEEKRKQKEIEEARRKLEEIRKRLEEEAKKQQLRQQQKEERKEEKREEKKEDKKEEKRENKNRDR